MNDKKSLSLISLGHFTVDAYAGFFPMYIAMKDLNLVKAGLIVTIGNMVSNFLQPLFGIIADRFGKEWILFIGMVFGPLFMSLIGLTDDYILLAILVIFGKMMISLFHPAATDLSTASASGVRSPLRFSFFSFVGTIAFAFTGLIFQSFCGIFGFQYSFLLAIPAIIAAIIVKKAMPTIPHFRKPQFIKGFKTALWNKKKAMLVLYFLVVIQSSIQVILVYSLPTLYREWGFPSRLWAMPHFFFTAAGAISVIIAGLLAKKVSPGKLIIGSMAADIPLWYLFLYSGTRGDNLSFLWLVLLGFSNFAAFPAMVVLGQRKLPEFGATVSGILMGAAWGLAGLAPLTISLISEWIHWDIPGGKLIPGLLFFGLLPFVAIALWIIAGGEKGLDRE